MTDHELQLKPVVLSRAGILTAKYAKYAKGGTGFWFVLFAYFAWFAVQLLLIYEP
jgi:hypothetical protein